MLNEEQKKLKEKRITLVVQTFLEGDFTSIKELAKALNMSPSTIQRDLNAKETIEKIFGEEIYNFVTERLALNKEAGVKRGGQNSVKRNVVIKDENGHFQGSHKIKDLTKEQRKQAYRAGQIKWFDMPIGEVNHLVLSSEKRVPWMMIVNLSTIPMFPENYKEYSLKELYEIKKSMSKEEGKKR